MKHPRKHTAPLPDRICIGVDESEPSEPAAMMGLELGHRLHVPVELVRALAELPRSFTDVEFLSGVDRSAELLEQATRSLRDRLQPLIEKADLEARTEGAAPAVRDQALVRVLHGKPAKVLLDVAGESEAPWIVLGGHTKRGVLDFGSTLRSVFAKVTVSVWLQPGPVEPIRRILVPVDLSVESFGALATACALAPALGSRVEAVHWFDSSIFRIEDTLERLGEAYNRHLETERAAEQKQFERAMEAFDWNGVDHDVLVRMGPPIAGILEASSAADLIVMGAHGRTGLASVILGGVAYEVLKKSDKPVLVVRAQEREYQLR